MAKILVTGGTGFVGKSLIPALIDAGHQVRCAVTKQNTSLDVEQIVINKLELHSDWTEALQHIDVVIHLAARVHIMQETAASSLDEFCKVNSTATKNLAEQAAKLGVKRFVFLSSIKVNGEFTNEGSPFTEECIVHPDDPYAKSKLYAEQYLLTISQNTDMDVVILRPPLVFGPGVKANFLKMLQLVNKGLPLPFGRIENKRSFVFIDNLVSAICTVTSEPKAANQIYLVADDESWSLSHLLRFLAATMGTKLRLFAIPGTALAFQFLGLGSLKQRLFGSLEVSNNKLKSQLGWSPPVTSAQGLERTAKWYRDEYNS